VNEVRLIGKDGEQLGVVATEQAIKLAEESGLDLVEVAALASPPVCRIMDYSRYKYEQEKKERMARKHQRAIHIKEIKFKPNIEEHDYQVKLAHMKRFLEKKDKVKFTLTYRGREMTHPEIGKKVVERAIADLTSTAVVEKGPTTEGRNIVVFFAPK
jgi:translation initiation factor IF-3